MSSFGSCSGTSEQHGPPSRKVYDLLAPSKNPSSSEDQLLQDATPFRPERVVPTMTSLLVLLARAVCEALNCQLLGQPRNGLVSPAHNVAAETGAGRPRLHPLTGSARLRNSGPCSAEGN